MHFNGPVAPTASRVRIDTADWQRAPEEAPAPRRRSSPAVAAVPGPAPRVWLNAACPLGGPARRVDAIDLLRRPGPRVSSNGTNEGSPIRHDRQLSTTRTARSISQTNGRHDSSPSHFSVPPVSEQRPPRSSPPCSPRSSPTTSAASRRRITRRSRSSIRRSGG